MGCNGGPGLGKPPAAGRKAMGEAGAEYGPKMPRGWIKMDQNGQKLTKNPSGAAAFGAPAGRVARPWRGGQGLCCRLVVVSPAATALGGGRWPPPGAWATPVAPAGGGGDAAGPRGYSRRPPDRCLPGDGGEPVASRGATCAPCDSPSPPGYATSHFVTLCCVGAFVRRDPLPGRPGPGPYRWPSVSLCGLGSA
jgi:hypothetical protein